ncbi:MAG TPA: hypothetical protein VIY56_06200, partial [Vicinamibacterales bacterium]
MTVLTPERVDDIAAMSDGAARNVEITNGYFALARGLATWTGAGGNWCAFAAWASRQAGRTIRGEDLALHLRRRLEERPALQAVITELREDLKIDRERLLEEIAQAVLLLPAARRSSEAVARGNVKVFAEIGRDIASLLALLQATPSLDEAGIRAFCESLPPGPPPDGRGLLAEAFLYYWRASQEADAGRRAQWILLANLKIGFHEQTRLQPEIEESLGAAALDPAELEVVIALVVSAYAPLVGVPGPLRRVARRKAAEILAREAAEVLRTLITNRIMTIELANGEVLRLGEDIPRPYPASLQTLVNADLQHQ